MTLTLRDITSVIGPADETLVASIVATGATPAELAEAWAWVNSDEAMIGEGRHLPAGVVATLVDLLSVDDEEWEE